MHTLAAVESSMSWRTTNQRSHLKCARRCSLGVCVAGPIPHELGERIFAGSPQPIAFRIPRRQCLLTSLLAVK